MVIVFRVALLSSDELIGQVLDFAKAPSVEAGPFIIGFGLDRTLADVCVGDAGIRSVKPDGNLCPSISVL